MCTSRFDALVILLSCFDNFKAKLLIELYGTIVIHLDVSGMCEGLRETMALIIFQNNKMQRYLQKYAIEIAIFFNIIKNMIDHDRTNAKTSIWI